ncbi:porin [Sphingomonas sp. KR1UV-12]|uniref:Porin n=1 Tax=Sphingomonas aurea TaxID=3063994 RepID=A0ABT9EIP8_9SPHN|nr:porin [Sphingomonas sp. KR1UV-12]MDP1026834.1 porin [Sphingomonas sp. KR1UV-12]
MMRTVKRIILAALACTTSVNAYAQSSIPAPVDGDAKVDALIRVLVNRGTITAAEGRELLDATRTEPAAPMQGTSVAVAQTPPPEPAAPATRRPPQPSAASPRAPSAADLAAAARKDGLTVDWKGGAPRFISPGGFSFKPRGRILVDADTTTGSRFDDRNITTTGARALRFGFQGTYGQNILYQVEADFSDTAEITSAYVGWRQKLTEKVTTELDVGSRLTERGLEGSSGSDQVPFMERNAVGIGLVPLKGFYGLGLTSKTFGPNWHVAAMVVGDGVDGNYAVSDTLTTMVRGHWNPIKVADGFVHVGGWGYREGFSPAVTALSLSVRQANRFNTTVRVLSGPLSNPDHAYAYGAELGGGYRNLWAFGEYGRRVVSYRTGAAATPLAAWALSAGWMVTGENVPFDTRTGLYTTVDVAHPLDKGGLGALGLVVRYDGIDYSDAPLGGESKTLTLGANWYLNNIVRIMLNYTHADLTNRTGPYVGNDTTDTFATRFQISF